MKNKCLVILFILFYLSQGSFLRGQENNAPSIQLSIEKDKISVTELFEIIEAQHDYRFSYASESFLQDSISFTSTEISLPDLLDEILLDRDYEYKLVSNNVLIRKSSQSKEQNTTLPHILHIRGKVVTALSDENLAFATICLENSSYGTYTDEQGNFELEIPEDQLNNKIVVSYMGFERHEFLINEKEDQYLFIPLKEKNQWVETIEIINREKPIHIISTSNAIALSESQINSTTSGVFGANPLRNVQLLAGITAHEDDNAETQVRGSTPDGTMLVLDGIPIYKSNHYFGIFSSINSSHLHRIYVYKNIFPIQYAGKVAGIVEMNTSDRQLEKVEGEIDLNLLTAELGLGIPISKKSSLLFSAKSSLGSVGNNRFNSQSRMDRGRKRVNSFKDRIENNQSNADVSFQDFQSKYTYHFSPNSIWQISSYYSQEDAENQYETEVINSENKVLKLENEETSAWNNLGFALHGEQKVNKKWNYSTNTYFSTFSESERNSILIKEGDNNSPPLPKISLNGRQSNSLMHLGHYQMVTWKEKNQSFDIGLEVNRYGVDYAFSENMERVFAGKNDIHKISLFASWEKEWSDKWAVQAGLRTNYFAELNATYFSPLIFVQYQLTEGLRLKSSYSNYQQAVRQLYFEYRAIPMDVWVSAASNDIPILRSSNIMFGSTIHQSLFTLDIEAYYKKLDGVIEYAALNPNQADNNPDRARDYRLFMGDGRVLGLDIMLSTSFKNLESHLAYTWSVSQERFPQILDNRFFPSQYDRRHQLKWMNTYEINRWTYGMNLIYASGRPYTNITSTGKNTNITLSDVIDRFNRLPAYRRMDLSISYRLAFKKRNFDINASIFNVFNNQNVKYIQTVITNIQENNLPLNTVTGGESALLNRTFNVGVKMEW